MLWKTTLLPSSNMTVSVLSAIKTTATITCKRGLRATLIIYDLPLCVNSPGHWSQYKHWSFLLEWLPCWNRSFSFLKLGNQNWSHLSNWWMTRGFTKIDFITTELVYITNRRLFSISYHSVHHSFSSHKCFSARQFEDNSPTSRSVTLFEIPWRINPAFQCRTINQISLLW